MKFYKSLCLLGLMAFSSYSSNSFAEEKTLNVVTEPTFAPFEFVDKGSSALIGFDIDRPRKCSGDFFVALCQFHPIVRINPCRMQSGADRNEAHRRK